jgi:hypothetical protein
MTKFINNLIYIPLGMCRSVERNNKFPIQHPVGDASLAGCKRSGDLAFFTKRCIPNGIRFQNFKSLSLIYSLFLSNKLFVIITINH